MMKMKMPPIVSAQEWENAREKLLVKEKELTRVRDAMAAERRQMPWMAVEKDYRFEGPNGLASLLDLFERRRQLIVYRFFYGPEVTDSYAEGGTYPERGCVGCSFLADQVAHPAHLNARDTTLAFVSRASQAEIKGLKKRMGWAEIPWYTIIDDFDTDFGVREMHGTNALSARADGSSAPTSSAAVAMRRWGAHGAISTSPRWGARRSGRTRRSTTHKHAPTSGGTITTRTARGKERLCASSSAKRGGHGTGHAA
jgi:predicted dithiol-disulfide oxidoreductase (DUF899 family)